MTILVTGTAGYVARVLAARDEAVIGVDDLNDYYDPQLNRDGLAALGDVVRFTQCDFADEAALDAALAGADVDRIVHLGAQARVRYSLQNPRAYVRSNLAGHVNVLELARARGVGHLVYASSSPA